MGWKPLAKRVAYWTIPPGLQGILRSCLSGNGGTNNTDPDKQAILNRNRTFLNKHVGQRCFVLATGPSIREQDLTPLRNEWCIAVSEFYKHEHYRLIKPAYYTLAPNHPPFTDEDTLRELEEMRRHASSETFFFGLNDKRVVERSALVTDGNPVHYLDFSGDLVTDRIDLTACLPPPWSATLIATWIAIYMGFSEIYLVGCDHDHLWKWDGVTPFTRGNYYQHFYDGAPSRGYEPMDVDRELRSTLKARESYKWSNQIALRQGTSIYNANPRNYLDVIPRVSLATLFK